MTDIKRESEAGNSTLGLGPISPVHARDWDAVLRLLFRSFGPKERAARIETTLSAVNSGQLSLTGLRQQKCDGQLIGASLTMSQPDGIHLVWPPVVVADHSAAASAREQLLAELCQRLDDEGARLGQVLLDAYDEESAAWLQAAGFSHETHLFFLAHDLEGVDCGSEPLLDSVAFQEDLLPRFGRVLESTYRGSLDCPLLEGIRSGEEAVASHRLSGRFDPALWRVFTISDDTADCEVDAGICLLNDHPDQDALELTYFGVVQQYRGRQLGRRLLHHALQETRRRGRGSLFLATDASNVYANELYAELGFTEIARRRVLFRPHSGLARNSSTGS